MRIACSGLIGPQDGSVSSAGSGVIRELLRRGHEIDFFSRPSFVAPKSLGGYAQFRYVDCSTSISGGIRRRLRSASRVVDLALETGDKLAFMRNVSCRMQAEQSQRRYDVEFFVGQWAYDRIPGIPVVSWVQGPPGTDVRSVFRQRDVIKKRCGIGHYAKLRAYSLYRTSPLGLPPFAKTDVVICGSRDSCRTLTRDYGVDEDAVHALPYPIDLAQFRPGQAASLAAPYRLLWVGRVVPRKRLDLFLGAGKALVDTGLDVHLDVIGGFPFAGGLASLLSEFPYQERLTHVAHSPREMLREKYNGAAMLIQSSEEENFGSAVGEALACGTPVLVGPTNGTRDYIDKGGEVFEDYSVAAVASAARYVLARRLSTTDLMQAAARAAAERHFDVSSVVDRVEDILVRASRRQAKRDTKGR